MNSTISIAIIKEWLTQSVAVGVGGAGAAAGGDLVLSLKNPPVNTVRRFHSFYSTYLVCWLAHLVARLLLLVLDSWLLRHKENVQNEQFFSLGFLLSLMEI